MNPEKLSMVFFSAGRLKITMKRHAACCMCQDYTSSSCLCAAEFQTVDAGCMCLALKIELCEHAMKKFFFYKKYHKGNQTFEKFF